MGSKYSVKRGVLLTGAIINQEIDDDVFNVKPSNNYMINASKRVELTLNPNLQVGDYINVIGVRGNWKIKGNYIFNGYKKFLLSRTNNDVIKLSVIYNNTLGLEINNRQIDILQYGFFGGGTIVGLTDIIDYIDTTLTTGNATDVGDLTVARYDFSGCSGIQYGFFAGGGGPSNTIDYIDITLTSGDAIDRGNLTASRQQLAALSGMQYGFFGGGWIAGVVDNIDYIDMTSLTSDAIDRGNITVARTTISALSGIQYGFWGGGATGAGGVNDNTIDYIDMTILTGNADDRGNLSAARRHLAAISSNGNRYGFFGGGYIAARSDIIDYIDITLTTGNATDRGNLTAARHGLSALSGIQYGYWGGGDTGGVTNIIDYIDMTLITGNATDRGDLSAARRFLTGL